jgi:cell division protein FtsQ
MLPWLKLSLQALLILLLGSAISWSVTWLRNPHNMPLRSVQIEGEFRKLSTDALQKAVGGVAQGGFFTVNVDAVRRAAESLPWVASATVRRVWPDTLQLQIVERRAAARWGDAGLLSMSGQLFMPDAASIPPNLPQLNGPEELRRRVMETYIAMTAALAPIGKRVAELRVDKRRAWLLRLDSGVELRLGKDNTLDRVERFVRIYPTVFAVRETELKTVDMRYSNGFAVRWDPSPEAAGQQHEG